MIFYPWDSFQGFLNEYFKANTVDVTTGSILTILAVVVIIVASYLLGSINLSIILSKKRYNDDIRQHGSGNAGMTNVLRTYGKKMAALTFTGDFMKAVIASLLGRLILGYYGAMLAGFFCFLGHIFPIFYKFKGGKGVVTALAMIMFTDPIVCIICVVIFVILVAVTKYVSLGSVVAVCFYPLIMSRLRSGLGIPILISFGVAAFCVFMHRGNLKRISERTENKLSFKKKTENEDEKGDDE